MLFKKMSSLAVLSVAVIGMSGCGGGPSDSSIDLANYMPRVDMIKHYNTKKQDLNGNIFSSESIETITVSVLDGHRVIVKEEGFFTDKNVIFDNNISTYNIRDELTSVSDRYADIGDTTVFVQDLWFMNGEWMDVTFECMLDEKINSFLEDPDGVPSYTGDILKVKCSTRISDPIVVDGVNYNYNNISYIIMKKDKGLIAKLNIYCVVNRDNGIIDDSNLSACPSNQIEYSIKLWDEDA